MKRIITYLTVLAVLVLLGCERHQGPVAPPQEQQAQSTSGLDFKATTAKLKEKLEALKTEIEERAAALRIQAAKEMQKQSQISQIARSKITVPDDYPTIQSAVNAASPGTKIIVKDGTYTEDILNFGKENLTITAEHKGQVYLDGFVYFESVTGGALEGFVITGGAPSGVFLDGCSEVEIKKNEVTGAYGIVLYASVDCVVKDNNVHNVPFGYAFGPVGITIYHGGKHLVKGNDFHDIVGFGIVVYGGLTGPSSPGKNEISSNECIHNLYGITVFASQKNDLGDNECSDNLGNGINLVTDSDRNKVGSDNEANNNGAYGLLLDASSDDNTVNKNEAQGNGSCDAVDTGTGNTFSKNNFGSFNCS